MEKIEYITRDYRKSCAVCGDTIHENVWHIIIYTTDFIPRHGDIHIHEGCLMRAIEEANRMRKKTAKR